MKLVRWAVGLMMSCAWTLTAQAQEAQHIEMGHLEVVWGDRPHNKGHEVMEVRLVNAQGRRMTLDRTQAQRAAGDLYMMSGKRVGVSFTQTKQGLVVDAIVPAQLASSKVAQHTVAKQVAAQGAVISGNTRWVTLACKFSDIGAEQKNISYFNSQYGNAPGQLGHYWNEVSYGKINLTGSQAYGWFSLPMSRASYILESGKASLGKLFQDCVGAAGSSVNFQGVSGINLMFNGELDGFAWGGTQCTTLSGQYKCWSTTWNPPWAFGNLAPLAHEMGHGYGLPHSNNSDGDSDTYDNPWDNMSDSWRNSVSDVVYGTLPKHINIFQRDRLGWVDEANKVTIDVGDLQPGQARSIELDAAGIFKSNNIQMVVLRAKPSSDPYATVLYTLETRVRQGAYERNVAGDAVIIHRVNQTLAYSIDGDNPSATFSNNEGSMFKVGESWVTPDGLYYVRIDERTTQGFVVTVGARRLTGGNQPALSR